MKILLFLLILTGCTPPSTAPTGNPACVGTNGASYTCSSGSCSQVAGAGCSAMVNGVACCGGTTNGGGTGPNDGTNSCSLGWCLSSPENICCPQDSPYGCNGGCYKTNTCNYTSIRTACHQW